MSMFDAREAAAKGAEEYPPFSFVGLDGETYELSHPATLETGAATQLAEAHEADNIAEIMRLFGDLFPDAIDAIKALPTHVFGQLLDAWMDTMDDSGKSPTPPSPPNRAARRSKRTSRSAAST